MRQPILALVMLVTVGAAACGRGAEPDVAATDACSEYRQFVLDVRSGEVPRAQLRVRLQDIDRRARLAHDDHVRDNARTLLRAVAAGERLPDQTVASLSLACTAYAME